MTVSRAAFAVAVTLGMAFQATPGAAALLDAQYLMQGFNNIVLGDVTAQAETEGSVFVGGDFTGPVNINPRGQSNVDIGAGVSGTLVVGGSVHGAPKLQTGDAVIGGTSTVINNGSGTVRSGISGIPAEEVGKVLRDASLELASWDDTPGGTANISDRNNISFDAVGDANNIVVFNISADALRSGTFKGVNAEPDVTVIINVSGTSATVGVNGNETGSNVLFNFYEAVTLNIDTAFNYSILAPLANIRLQGGGINGTMVSNNLTQYAEIRPDNFSGTFAFEAPDAPSNVPAPPALWLMAGALAGFGALKARRRAI